MKKTAIYTAIVLLLIAITVSATYAYLVASINTTSNATTTEGAVLEVEYTKGENIEGILNLSEDKTGGLNTTVNIKLNQDSVQVLSNLYIDISEITSTIANNALNWEVYKTINGTETFVSKGTFGDCGSGIACVTGNRLYIVNGYELTSTNTSFTVYIWLDGHMVGNEVVGAKFKGKIGAESEDFSGELR